MTASARAWRAGRLDDARAWYVPVPAAVTKALAPLVSRPPEPLTAAVLPVDVRHACRDALQPVAEALEHGRGFVIVGAVAGVEDDARRTLLYWLLGQALGEPVTQNVQGTLLYDVKDTGQDVRYGARFSVTNAESSFHTDASFWPDVVDIVGLLCLRPARSGGVNHLVSGYAVRDELAARYPEALAALRRRYHVDRRGGARPGEPTTTEVPILEERPDGLLFRYLRYWIEAGQEKVGQPLSAEEKWPLDRLDEVTTEPSLRAEFSLRAGEMLFLNNRWLLHNRTAFEDHDDPAKKRHLVRLWLRIR